MFYNRSEGRKCDATNHVGAREYSAPPSLLACFLLSCAETTGQERLVDAPRWPREAGNCAVYRNTSSYLRSSCDAEEGETFGVVALCVLLAACLSCQLLSENIRRAYGQSILIIPEGVSNSGTRPSAPLTSDRSKKIQPLIYLELEGTGEQDLVLIGRVSTQSVPEAESTPTLRLYVRLAPDGFNPPLCPDVSVFFRLTSSSLRRRCGR